MKLCPLSGKKSGFYSVFKAVIFSPLAARVRRARGAEVRKVGQRVETISVADLCDSHIRVLEVFQDAFSFLAQNPFVYRYAIHVLE